jgi:hypothetical protein
MLRPLAAASAALLLVSCGSSITLPVASPSPSPIGADSPAADLRTHVDLLFGEHTFVIAKLAVAAVAGRKDEFHTYAGALAANGADITTLMRSALGETAGSQFGQTWTVGNNYFVDYLVAGVTHDNAKQAAAGSGLTGTYLPQLTALLTSTLSLTADQDAMVGADQVSSIKQVVDDAVTSGFAAFYTDLHGAYVKAIRGGDLVSEAIVSRFVDRFPGSARSKSADFRAVLDTLLLSQAYLMTMASDASVTGTAAQISAVSGALAQSATSLGAVFTDVFGDASGAAFATAWGRESMLVVAYAKGADPSIRQSVIDAAAPPGGTGQVFGPDMTVQLIAVLQAVDDQRAKAFDRLGDDDRSAAGQLAAVGDAVTGVAVREAPAKFL